MRSFAQANVKMLFNILEVCYFYVTATLLLFQEPLFAARVVYDLLFYFIVIIIVLNLIFGVIIDTFADLRSEKQKKEEILKTTCFICGRCYWAIETFDGEKSRMNYSSINKAWT